MQELSDQRLLKALEEPTEHSRSAAAVELARRNHPQALEACLRTLNDAAELKTSEITPSVWCLVGMGAAAAGPLLGVMAQGDDLSRLRAATAFIHISKRRFGFDGNRWPDGSYARWSQWWSGAGYDHRADAGVRTAATQRLRDTAQAWV